MQLMTKQLLLLTICLSTFYSSFSQEFTLGARVGFNNHTIGDINSRGGSIQAGKADELFSPQKS